VLKLLLLKSEGPTSNNDRVKGALLLYMVELASSRFVLYHGYFATFLCWNRDESLQQH